MCVCVCVDNNYHRDVSLYLTILRLSFLARVDRQSLIDGVKVSTAHAPCAQRVVSIMMDSTDS